ncbi:MAG: response regulator, partial [Planctomycetes bacterium]|nr:response regulator [Planctomycetota bacterium]
ERNMRLLPWWWVLRWVWLGEAVWIIYLIRERGLTLGQVALFEAVFMAVGLGVLVILIAGVFRLVVTRRLILMRTHFERIAAQPDAAAWRPAEVRGSDEISALGRSFNTMVDRIRDAHASLEQRVADRTAELRTHSAALAAAANAIVITDRNGCITWVNPAFTDLTGYTSKAAIGQNPRFLKSDKCDDAFYRDLWNTILAGDVWHGELVNRRKDGSLYTEEMTVTPVKDEGGAITHFIAIKQDVSERKRADEQLRKTNAMLEEQTARAGDMAAQAELANAAKSEFLANMSHEIRTPMTALLGHLELIAEGCPRQCEFGRVERVAQTETVKRNAEHLLRLIDNILDLSKLEAGKLEVEQVSCSVVELVSDVQSLMRPRADQNNLTLDVEYSGPIPTVIRTDPTRLKQILINMVGNALKFTETGSIRLVVSLLRETASGPQMRLDVIDSGIGLTAEQTDLIFEAFTQADTSTTRKFGGTGLGLRISKQLTELLGGTITVKSKPGQGSRFRVTVGTGSLDGVKMLDVPATTTIARPEEATATKMDHAKLDCRILLAEDGPDNQRLIAHVLRKAGAEATVVENGKLAVDAALAARDEGSPFDVILMDMQMPVMDGYQATGLLRQKGYSSPIIALTAHAMAGDRQKCLDAGCDDYASKPINSKKLITTIARHVLQAIST